MCQKTVHYVFSNWSKTHYSYPALFFEPKSIDELQNILTLATHNNKKVKVVGGGLSPSDVACTNDYMISMKYFNKVLDIDSKKYIISVESGVTIRELNQRVLPINGLSLINQGSVCDQTIGGIIGTGSHGTGRTFGSFASCILEITFMKPDGCIITCSQHENCELFQAIRCHIGVLGIILSAKIQCESSFSLHMRRQSGKLEETLKNLNSYSSSSQHFRFLWFPHTDNVVTFMADRTNKDYFDGNSWFWSKLIGYYFLEFCLWISIFVPFLVPVINKVFFKLVYEGSYECIGRSDQIFNIDCLFKQHVTEWAIPFKQTTKMLLKMRNWLSSNPKVKAHFPVEVRFVKKDDIMLSPSGIEDVTYIGIISYRPYGRDVPHSKWWNFFENLALDLGGKPHWAKAHKMKAANLRKMYPQFDRFMEIQKDLDPEGLFINEYWQRIMQ